jgi:hypothetical protein
MTDEIDELHRLMAILHDRFDKQEYLFSTRIKELVDEVEEWKAIVQRMLHTPSANGTFPPLNQIEKLVVQIFHEPIEMNKSRLSRGTTGWSLRIEHWQHGQRQKPVNIKMTKPRNFIANLKNPAPNETPPSAAIQRNAQLVNSPESGAVAGIVRRKTMGHGSPFVPSQVAIMIGHERQMEDVLVSLMIGDANAAITSFRMAGGTKPGHALWMGSWTNPVASLCIG